MHTGKTLLNLVDVEEKERQLKNRKFELPDFRTGDVLKVSTIHSTSENQEKSYTGVCFFKSAPNSIRAKAKINFSIEGVNTQYGVSIFSPMLTGLEILKYGSNKNRKKLPWIPAADMPAGRMQEAVIKGRNYKSREKKETVEV